MTLPAGVDTRTIQLTVPLDALGRLPKVYAGTVRPDRTLIWAATGERLWPVGAKLPAVVDGMIEFDVPRVDQTGWVDESGSAITGFSFLLTVRGTWAADSRTLTKVFQIVASTPDLVDIELIPSGATVPVSLVVPFDASEIPFDPTAEISATDVQAAIEEVRAEGGGGGGVASSVVVAPAGTISSTNVQAALEELDTEKAPTSHTHAIANVTGLQSALDGRATDAELTAEADARIAADTALDGRLDTIEADNATQTELNAEAATRAAADNALDARVDALEVAPPAHTHTIANVTGLQAELDADDAALAAHLADTTDAHDASAISVVPAGTISATNVQAALEEIAAESGGAGETWTYERRATDWTNSTITTSDIFTGFVPIANTRYEVECFLIVKSADATSGLQLGLMGPGGLNVAAQKITMCSSATADLIGNVVGFGIFAAGSTPANYGIAKVSGFVEYGASPAAGNNVRLIGRAETAGQVATVRDDSYMRWRILP